MKEILRAKNKSFKGQGGGKARGTRIGWEQPSSMLLVLKLEIQGDARLLQTCLPAQPAIPGHKQATRKQSSTSSTIVLRVALTFKNQVQLLWICRSYNLDLWTGWKKTYLVIFICRYWSFSPPSTHIKYHRGHMWIEVTPFPLYLQVTYKMTETKRNHLKS